MIWSKHDIKLARQMPLLPILKKLGYALRKLERDNYLVEKYGSLIIKHNYWFWKENHSSGNSIDFFISVEHKSFAQAMSTLSPKK